MPKKENHKIWLWTFLGIVLAIAIIALFGYLFKGPSDNGTPGTGSVNNLPLTDFESAYFSEDTSADDFIKVFERTCPDIGECEFLTIIRYLQKLIFQKGYDVDDVPHIDEIRSYAGGELAALRADFSNPENFWKSFTVIPSAAEGGAMNGEEINDWIRFLSGLEPSEFCSEVFSREVPGELFNEFGIPISNETVYGYYCNLAITISIMNLLIVHESSYDFPIIEELKGIVDDFDATKQRLCNDVSGIQDIPNFEYISTEGAQYLYYVNFCGFVLTDEEVLAYKTAVESANPSPRVQAIYDIVSSMV